MSQNPSCTVVFLGSTGVGKTTIIYAAKGFCPTHVEQTTCVGTYPIDIETTSQGIVSMNVWDTAGQKHFEPLTKSIISKANCFVIIFDITSPDSFQVERFVELASEKANNPFFVLVGNKIDLSEARSVGKTEIDKAIEAYNIQKYFETSALTKENISELFQYIAEHASENNNQSTAIHFDDQTQSNRCTC